jgi:segregation and condensation protein A
MYELKTETFSGPLEKLLELIEAHEMDVSQVSMAQVTDDFLKYLETLRKKGGSVNAVNEVIAVNEERMATAFEIDIRILADFISVASRLIFLKSKYLLPNLALTEEEEADIKDLEGRLKTYQALRPALRHIAKLWRESHRSYSRPYLSGRSSMRGIFYPGKELDATGLFGSLDRIFETMKAYELETDTIREKIVTLEEKVSQVLDRIQKEGDMHFRHLSGEQSRGETIVAFLAILHLAREQIILLEQIEQFSDIMIRKRSD